MRVADLAGSFSNGLAVGNQASQIKRQNSLADLYKTQGAGIAAGETGALNALAQLDPMAARGIQRENALDQRQQQSHNMSMQVSQAQLEGLRTQAKQMAAQEAASLDAAAAADEARKIDGFLSGASVAYQQGPEALTAFVQMNAQSIAASGIDPSRITPETFPQVMATLIGAREGIEAAQKAVSGMTGQGASDSDKEQQIQRIMQTQGVSRAEAVRLVDGVVTVSRDPTDGSALLFNKLTGEATPATLPQQQDMTQPPPVVAQPQLPPADGAFGVEGIVKRGLNATADAVGLDMPYAQEDSALRDFDVLREQLTNDIAGGYNRQPPSWLLKNIQELTPRAGTLAGPGAAKSKLESLSRSIATEAATIDRQLSRKQSPTNRAALEGRLDALQTALWRVESAMARLGNGSQQNTTSSGVSWSIEQ